MTADLSILLRLVVALVLAGAMGWERESTGKPAGLRTHMLVGMGAALFVSLAGLVIHDFQHLGDALRFDPLRILEAVVAAVGFLGAGTIFVSRGKDHVKGLTTAASLWATAGVGIAVGLERYVLAIGTTVLILAVLRVIRRYVEIEVESVDEEGDPSVTTQTVGSGAARTDTEPSRRGEAA
ncbi:MAG: MgtC/SapB family protein [Chloroflexota bacterium]|nr:MgtC/SapB family protein [Chloroflexota bacterium]